MRRAFLSAMLAAVLNVALVFAQNSTTPPSSAKGQDFVFSVAAGEDWVDTGIDLYPGDRVHVAGGVIGCAGLTHSDILDLPVRSAPVGALLAKLHLEARPVLATPDAQPPIIRPSHLYLGVNGWRCPGKIPAKVHLEHSPATRGQ